MRFDCIINLLSAELAKRVVKVKGLSKIVAGNILFIFFFFFRENKTWPFM